jgi:hypothetical protein
MTNELFIQAKWDTLGHRIAPCPEMGKGLDREGFGCPGGVPIIGDGMSLNNNHLQLKRHLGHLDTRKKAWDFPASKASVRLHDPTLSRSHS